MARMAEIRDYSFGRMVVDDTEHRRDLIVLPDRVVPEWWRKDGHSLAMERLVLGCGADGRLRPDPAVIEALRERGVEVEALPTGQAVDRYRELDPSRTAGAFHLTC